MRILQSKSELENHLKEQVHFLRGSMRSYDEGFEGEAKRLAVTIRVLVHDTSRSHSLLSLLTVKDSLEYYDAVGPRDFTKEMVYIGLSMGFTDAGLRYYPKLGRPQHKAKFKDWWNRIVILQKVNGVLFTRKDIVLAVSNMDGGAHVDPLIDAEYAALSRRNRVGWELIGDKNKIMEWP